MFDERLEAAADGERPQPRDVLVAGDVLSASWLVGASLGTGGMADVYAATGLQGERAALKVMRSGLVAQAGALQRFLREGVIARRVEHPGMVGLLGEGTTDRGRPYLALELLDGCTIDELWRADESRPSLQSLLQFFVHVLDLLAVCHEGGIVHRDLKPANIYAMRRGGAKVLDFGVARAKGLSEDFLRPGTAMGTPSFMAPEQAMGAWDQVDERADVFSIGATLFFLLSGQRLHMGRSEAESFTLAATRMAPSLGDVAPALPGDVVAFVDRALAWDKRARFADAAQMRDILKRITLSLDPVDAPVAIPLAVVEPEPCVVAPESAAGIACAEAFQLLHDAWFAREDRRPAAPALVDATRRLADAVEAEMGLALAVLPWCLQLRRHVVWSPAMPFAASLAAMFDEGIRSIEFRPDCPPSALRRLLEVLLDRADPTDDDGCDFVSLLWPFAREGIHVGVAAALLGASAGTAESAVNGQLTVRRFLDAAGGVCERPPLLDVVRMERIWLDDTTRAVIEATALPADEPADRAFPRQLVRALREVNAIPTDDGARSLLRSVARDLLRDERADLLLQTAVGLCEVHDRDAMLALLPPDTLHELVLAIDRQQGQRRQPNASDSDALQALTSTLEEIGESGVPSVLPALADLESSSVGRAVTDYVQHHLSEYAHEIVEALPSLSGEIGHRLVVALAEGTNEVVRSRLDALARCDKSPLRIAAHAAIHGAADIAPEIVGQLDAPGWRARLVALRTIETFRLEQARSALLRRIDSPAFHGLGRRERAVTLTTLAAVDAAAAESAAAKLVRKHGLLRDDALNETRVLAAELLQSMAQTSHALEALRSAEAPMWWNPTHVRNVARKARTIIEARAGRANTDGES